MSVEVARRGALGGGLALVAGCALPGRRRDAVIHQDDFRDGLGEWVVEAEQPGRISAANGILDIDVPAGVTLWFRHVLAAPVAIEYSAMAVAEGGPNDAVSDLNCFWMATDPRAPAGDVLARRRSGAFADYDELLTYYAGIGGNRNTTTRMRRYIGERDNRPLRPEHDLSGARDMLVGNEWTHIRLVAGWGLATVERDGRTLFTLDDPAPYERGHFGMRTTKSHLRVAGFRVTSLSR